MLYKIFFSVTLFFSIVFNSSDAQIVTASEIYKEHVDKVVYLKTEKGVGSGFFIHDNFIITNRHVLFDGDNRYHPPLIIRKNESTISDFEGVACSLRADLCMIHLESIENEQLEELETRILQITELSVGSRIFAIGHPLGADWIISEGIVNSEERLIDNQFVTTISAPVIYGSSGGPLINESSEIVGVVQGGMPDFVGLSWALSKREISIFIRQVKLGELQSEIFRIRSHTFNEAIKKMAQKKESNQDNIGLDNYRQDLNSCIVSADSHEETSSVLVFDVDIDANDRAQSIKVVSNEDIFKNSSKCLINILKKVNYSEMREGKHKREFSKRVVLELNSNKPYLSYTVKNEITNGFFPSKNEKWYLQFGIGLSSFNYSSEAQIVVDELDNSTGLDKVGLNLDLLGVYLPVNNHRTLVGGMLSAAAERWSGAGGSVQINQYLVGPSMQHYFGRNIGDGWFLRGELGLSFFSIDIDSTSILYRHRSKTGFGFLFGGGYGVALGRETRMLVNTNLARRAGEGASSTTLNLNLGFLF